ncbi:hypothetical protein KEM09_20365 [Carboxylicivirga mesophila]|uniref:HEAT repeat domain-containing protein n=1 Tax=Carboxylicivirga mesophila TaxID=1166478 RepID=A0ABS5KFD4_9BACT|nr:hypothetical protein [Carboxylicivirga mesophila]MBS2213774.1 hypothetical protein [Carboxylicivirga mesophila]
MTKYIFNIISFLCFSLYCQAQKSISLDNIFESFRQGKYPYSAVKEVFREYESQEIIDIANKYISSEDERDRQLSYRLLYDIVEYNKINKSSQNAVYHLIEKGLTDKSSKLVSSTLDYLDEFPEEVFDNRCKNRLAGIIMEYPSHYKRIVMLSGKLKMEQLTSYYKNRLKRDSIINYRDKWALQLTLARMGDPLMVNQCIDQVEAIGINDQVIYNLIPDLLYIEDKQITDYLLDELAVENLNCTSADPDNDVVIDCGYRLAEYIAPVIQGFPISVGASGDLDCDNYEQALLAIRAWIAENRESYKVVFGPK